MSKLKILFLDTKPIRRGAQIYINDLKIRFINDGYVVKRIFLYNEFSNNILPIDEYDLILNYDDNNIFEKIPSVNPFLLHKLGKEIIKFSPDIILCNGSRTLKYAAFVKMFYSKINAKWVYRIIDSASFWNRRFITKIYYKYLIIRAMDGAIGVSEQSLADMVSHYRFKKSVIHIPRAIDFEYFSSFKPDSDLKSNLGLSNEAILILFLGSFTSQKRPDRFIDIIYLLKKKFPNVYGLMVGNGPLYVDIVNHIDRFMLTKDIFLVGSHSDVRPWIFISDLLLLTSDTEGMPGVVLEASAMNVPVIASNVGGIPEVIKSGKNGIIIDDFQNLNNFFDNINYLLTDENAYLNLKIECQRSLSDNYSITNTFMNYKKYFYQLCKSQTDFI